LLIEIVRFVLVVICLILAIFATFRLEFQSKFVSVLLRTGLLLILLEHLTRISVGLLINFVNGTHFSFLEFIRSSSSIFGLLGAAVLSIALAIYLTRVRRTKRGRADEAKP
jgi:putative effector of murein hydrolase